ncbi:MAG: riboflavin synthase [Solirubrobacterales bacterium]|nr:riboflavin synthase [Solirubrobacterales bacterium]
MFTGIVSELGTVGAIEGGGEGVRLRIEAALASELERGDSVAVDGACLTAAEVSGGAFEADVMNQTLELTTLGGLSQGDPVNLELALRASDRLGGHVVQGHVDGVGTVTSIAGDGFARRLKLELPDDLLPYVVERGSIAIAGTSLTVSALGGNWIEVSLVPETLGGTTLGDAAEGDRLNVECDVLARYVRRQASVMSPLEPESEAD